MQTRKKILFVSHEIKVNGSNVSLLSLIKGIQAIAPDIAVTVLLPVSFGKKGPAYKIFKKNKIHTKQLLYRENYKRAGNTNFLLSMAYAVYDIWNFIAVYALSRYIKKSKFDIVCSNSSAVDVGARAACLTNTPHIYYIREFMEEDHGIEYRNKRRMKTLLEDSDYIIFISRSIEKKYTSLYGLKKTIQFYDGFCVDNYYVENHIIFQSDMIRLIQVGVYSDGKGTLDSIRMMYLLKQTGITEFHLEFVGSGSNEYVSKMIALIKQYNLNDNITISEYTNNIKEKLAQADILLMNSRAEGFGRVTVEGMLAGCLILGRNDAGTAEIVQHGVNGLLYSSDEEFYDNITQIFRNCEYCRNIARIGQKKAMNEYDYYKTIHNFVNFVFDNNLENN